MAFGKTMGFPVPGKTLLSDSDLSPTVVMLLAILYLGGVVYGIFMKMMLGQIWLASLPNLVTIAATVTLAALVITGRLPFGALLHTACLSGSAIFMFEGAWWHFGALPNSLLVFNVSACCSMMFCGLLILVGKPWCGFTALAATLGLYAVESALFNSLYSLIFLGLCLPMAIAYGITLLLLRLAIRKKMRVTSLARQDRGILDQHGKSLSESEKRCLGYLLEDLGTKEIARLENVSISAIHNRFSLLYRKLNVVDRQQLRALVQNNELRW
jgi:DNA-binding CsgD family transcriptional regulator